jgi:drug/metabolite transporter (DMT)-like permease
MPGQALRACLVTLFALTLVLAAAFFHASWNLLAKRAGDGGPAFVWLFNSLSLLIYGPLAVAVVVFQRPEVGPLELVFMLGSGVLHLGYFLLLQRGYGVGDLSLVYPLARGTGPLIATAAAIVLFGERPTLLALSGVVLITAGVFLLAGHPGALKGSGSRLNLGVAYGLLTGASIAAYTLWDKHAVSALLIPPLLQNWAATLVSVAALTPLALQSREKVVAVWREYRSEVLGVALLTPLSYILVLTALISAPVSYVAPAREVSILIGTAMGARLLAEGDSKRRLFAAGAVVLGVVALALG